MSVVNVIKFRNVDDDQSDGLIQMYYETDLNGDYKYVIDVAYKKHVYRFNISKDILKLTNADDDVVLLETKRGGSHEAVGKAFDLNRRFKMYGPGAYTQDMIKRIFDQAFVATSDPTIKKLKSRLRCKPLAKLLLSRVSRLPNTKEIHEVIQKVIKSG